MQPLALTEPEIDDFVAFLASLTSSQYRELGQRELERQHALSRTTRPQRDTNCAVERKSGGWQPTRSYTSRLERPRESLVVGSFRFPWTIDSSS